MTIAMMTIATRNTMTITLLHHKGDDNSTRLLDKGDDNGINPQNNSYNKIVTTQTFFIRKCYPDTNLVESYSSCM